MRYLDVWYAHAQIEEGLPQLRALLDKQSLKQAERAVDKARTRDSLQAFDKLTTVVDGERRIISDPPLIVPVEEMLSADQAATFGRSVHDMLRTYRRSLLEDRRHLLEQFRFVHLARKVVGVGSVGTRDWIVLMLGRDDRDPLFLQAKEANASVLEPFLSREPVLTARPARRRGAAADADRQRHLPGLGAHGRARRHEPRLLRAAAQGLEGRVGPRDHGARRR